MNGAISNLIGGEEIISSEYIYRAKDVPEEVDGELEEAIVELREDLLDDPDCVRVWSEFCDLCFFLIVKLLLTATLLKPQWIHGSAAMRIRVDY